MSKLGAFDQLNLWGNGGLTLTLEKCRIQVFQEDIGQTIRTVRT